MTERNERLPSPVIRWGVVDDERRRRWQRYISDEWMVNWERQGRARARERKRNWKMRSRQQVRFSLSINDFSLPFLPLSSESSERILSLGPRRRRRRICLYYSHSAVLNFRSLSLCCRSCHRSDTHAILFSSPLSLVSHSGTHHHLDVQTWIHTHVLNESSTSVSKSLNGHTHTHLVRNSRCAQSFQASSVFACVVRSLISRRPAFFSDRM